MTEPDTVERIRWALARWPDASDDEIAKRLVALTTRSQREAALTRVLAILIGREREAAEDAADDEADAMDMFRRGPTNR